MKPYLAILIDSFWEAIGNRVLWALLLGWSLILLGLAPFGYVVEQSYRLSSVDIDDRGQLVTALAAAAKGEGNRAVRAVADRLDPKFVVRLGQAAASDGGQASSSLTSRELAQQLNRVIEQADLYTDENFPSAARRARLEPLIDKAQRQVASAEETEELNRELLQLAFPLELRRPQGEQLWIGYAGFKLGDPLPVSRRQIKQFFEPILLASIIKLGLGILAVFVAIVVTSPIIPDTFRSGSLHLLLSKPISRVWLYLAKFFGGCIFVLVNITYVLIGLYFIAGTRFDIWNVGLMACIPILMFVFIIFYSVSGLAGLVWNNAIVSVVACMIFWVFCFAVGFLHDALLPQAEVLAQIQRIESVEDHLLVVNERGEVGVWNAEFAIWQPALEGEVHGQARTFGPIYNAQRRLMIVKSFFRAPFGGLQSRSRKISIIRLDAQPKPLDEETPQSLAEARDLPRWLADSGPELPQQLFDLVDLDGTILAICRGGLFRLDLDQLQLSEGVQKGLFGLKLPWLTPSAFENIAPADYYLTANASAAATAAGDGLIVFNSGSLEHLAFDGQRLRLVASGKLDGDGTEAALVQMNAEYCVVARDGLPLKILDSDLRPLADCPLPAEQTVKQMAWIPETSQLALVTHTGNAYRLDCGRGELAPLTPQLQGQLTSLQWQADGKLWLGIKPNSVYGYDLQQQTVLQRFVPQPTWLEWTFRWLVRPLYVVNPKPAALDAAMIYVLTGNQTQSLGLVTNDLKAAQLEIDLWTPLISNCLFVAAVVGFSCWYVWRKEY